MQVEPAKWGRLLRAWTLALSAMLMGFDVARAAEITHRSLSSGLEVISIDGDIKAGDDTVFGRLAVEFEKAIVVLSSDGGSLPPAIQIGKAIHLRGFGTYVPEKSRCTSACALIWVAGARRILSATSRIGFHAAYREIEGRQEETGVGNAIVGRYLTLLNLSEKAIIFVTSASPTEISWINPRDSSVADITFELLGDSDADEQSPASASSEAASAQPDLADYQFSWSQNMWKVFPLSDGCALTGTFDTENRIDNDSQLIISLDDDGQVFLMDSNEKFRSVVNGKKYIIDIVFKTGTKYDHGWKNISATGTDELPGIGKGIAMLFQDESIISDVLINDQISFFNGTKLVDSFPLAGARAGIVALRRCVAGRRAQSIDDPFSG
jgi:hypothetical protein